MPMLQYPLRSTTVMGFLVLLLIPVVAVVTRWHALGWLDALTLFYVTLGVAELSYLAALLFSQRVGRMRSFPPVNS